MLNKPSLDELMSVVESRYTLVVAAAKRARQITEQDEQGLFGSGAKPVTHALEEIAAGKINLYPGKQSVK